MARNPVFIDTAAFIAMTVKSDSLHDAAMRVMESLAREKSTIATSELVLIEYLNASSNVTRRGRAGEFARSILASSRSRVAPVNHATLIDALDLYELRPDKEWGLVDCSSMLICKEFGIKRVFTHDRHFREAGFEILL